MISNVINYIIKIYKLIEEQLILFSIPLKINPVVSMSWSGRGATHRPTWLDILQKSEQQSNKASPQLLQQHTWWRASHVCVWRGFLGYWTSNIWPPQLRPPPLHIRRYNSDCTGFTACSTDLTFSGLVPCMLVFALIHKHLISVVSFVRGIHFL